MNKRRTFTSEQLREIVHYNPDTGVFTWLPRSYPPSFNATFGGKEAGGLVSNDTGIFYKMIRVHGSKYLAHILAHVYVTGQWPTKYIDHVDGNGLNNSWTNLRLATAEQNSVNSKLYSRNTSGLRGVSYSKAHNRWRSTYGKTWLGQYKTKEEAYAVYVAHVTALHGEFTNRLPNQLDALKEQRREQYIS